MKNWHQMLENGEEGGVVSDGTEDGGASSMKKLVTMAIVIGANAVAVQVLMKRR